MIRPIVPALVLLCGVASGKFAMPHEVPVERLIRNLEARVKKSPLDVRAHYALARVHSLALSAKAKTSTASRKRRAQVAMYSGVQR